MKALKFLPILALTACSGIENATPEPLPVVPEPDPVVSMPIDAEQKKYWYAGQAEITSFKLEQARYGEIHEGTASMVFVTEPFSAAKGSKVDRPGPGDVSVLKLNFTKKFNTGIYPYSMMTSTFVPVETADHSLKVSSSSQEWCGHTYMELRNNKKFNISIASYFEGESKSDIVVDKTLLEDDLWTRIRLAPEALPTGDLMVIPSFFYLRLRHRATKAYKASATIEKQGETSTYTLSYPGLDRSLSITFESAFPYQILEWQETYSSGFGAGAKDLTTKATRIKTIKSDYWNHNGTRDASMRTDLGLD